MRIITMLVILIFLGTGCSVLSKKTFTIVKPKLKKSINFGPTSSEETIFKSSAHKVNLAGVKATNLYAVDFNSDGETDLVVLPDHYSTPKFYRYNKKNKRYSLLAYDPFLEKNQASFLTFADLNKDGVLDLFMGTLNQKTELTKYPLRVFKGRVEKGKIFYSEIINALPSETFPHSSLVLLDYNLDGELDLFLGNWYDYSTKTRKMSADRLLKGKGFIFKDVTGHLSGESRFIKSDKIYPNAAPTRGAASCDLNQDGYPEIMTAVSTGYPNKLWVNSFDEKYGRIFNEIGKKSNYAYDDEGRLEPRGGGNTYFVRCTDYNNDSFMDIAMGELSHSYDSELRDRSSILTGGKIPFEFSRFEYYMDDGTGKWTQADRRGGWFDYNFDGLIDLFVVNSGYPPKSRLILFEQADDHAFEDVAKKVGINISNPSGTVTMDINRDGKIDLVTGQSRIRNASINNKLFVFENNTEFAGSRSLRVYPRGVRANSMAIGATVVLKSKKLTQRRWVEYASGTLPSQNEEGIFFGIPKGDELIELSVRWPILSNKKPLEVHYNLENLKFKESLNLTVCENGQSFPAKKKCSN